MSESLNYAINALEAAISELNDYAKSRDLMLLRDAAEKGWLVVSKTIEVLLRARALTLGPIGRSTRLGRSSYTSTASTMAYAMRIS